MEKINLVIWTGNALTGGVDVWVKELRRCLKDSRYNIVTISDGNTFAGGEKVNIYIHSWDQCARVLGRLSPAVVMPNWRHKLFGICAKLNKEGSRLSCLGACHADSAEEYYGPLAWYESAISGFMAVSGGCARTLAEYIPRRKNDIELVTYGITVPAREDRQWAPSPLKMVYFGRIEQKQKNVFDLAALAALLDDKGVDYSLDIIGSGPDKRELASKFAGSKRVRLSGQVEHAELMKMLRGYDVFVQVSSFEGQSVSMLEAMATGVIPCVTRASGGGWRIIEDGRNGFTADVGDMEAMALAIKEISGMDMERADTTGRAARRTVEDDFDITKNISAFTKLADKCSKSAGRQWAHGDIYDMPGGWSLNYLPKNEIAGIAMKTAFRFMPRIRLRHLVHRLKKGAK
jgi:glycosyltransferase involved in cell wall biosynthesis